MPTSPYTISSEVALLSAATSSRSRSDTSHDVRSIKSTCRTCSVESAGSSVIHRGDIRRRYRSNDMMPGSRRGTAATR